ncbi:MAG: hypothetical protein ACOC1K_06175 [Nanoarchaeota archaeon]
MQKNQMWQIIVLIVLSLVFYWLFSPNVGDILAGITYFVSVIIAGLTGGLIVSIVAPLLAGLVGLLGSALSEVLFSLIIANVLLVLGFWLFTEIIFKEKNILGIFLGVLVGSILRAIPVTISANNITDISPELRNALGFPQFASALLGGLILWILYIILAKTNNLPSWFILNKASENN